MSVKATHPDQQDQHSTTSDIPECAYCGAWRNPEKDVAGSYCSAFCYFADRGRKALKNVEKDHRFCRSCFAQVKTIERPPEDYPEFVVGYQYATDDAERVSREYVRDLDNRRGRIGAPNLFRRRLGCNCGNCDTSTWDGTLATADLYRTLVNLVAVLREKYREEKLDQRVQYRRLFDAYRATESINYAAGVGLYASAVGVDPPHADD